MQCLFLLLAFVMLTYDVRSSDTIVLGTSARIAISCSDIRSSLPFYKQLGFSVLATDSETTPSFARLSDGTIILTLISEPFRTPALAYFTADLQQTCAALQQKGIAVQTDTNEHGEITAARITGPDSLTLWLHRPQKKAVQPAATPNSVCGTFGELAIGVSDLDVSIAYWEQLGFRVRHRSDLLYPFAIMTDGAMIIGLHNNKEVRAPAITYFAKDMADRIERLKKEGVQFVVEFPPGADGRIANAVAKAPDGQMFYLFEGEL